MLLSSVAEAMFWSGRYIERAQALARAIEAVERLSLDLPGHHASGLAALLELVSAESDAEPQGISQASALRALALDGENTSSVLGALRAARENLRQARVCAPPELWLAVTDQYRLLSDASEESIPGVLDALSSVLSAGSRIKGVLESNMTRDAGYSFLNIGIELERADMLLRVLGTLLPTTRANGWERTFDDVRWSGLLQALGVRSMFRQRHHHQTELSILLDFISVDPSSPRSVVHCLRLVEGELFSLPRAKQASLALTSATSSAFALAHAESDDLPAAIEATLCALAAVHRALVVSYFPELQAISPARVETESDAAQPLPEPADHSGREQEKLEAALDALDRLANGCEAAESVEHANVQCIVTYLTDGGNLGHHEKVYLSVLGELARRRSAWSTEDGSRFATDARVLGHLLRSRMRPTTLALHSS
jgi:uncharacterized alpha-E superfamily protein